MSAAFYTRTLWERPFGALWMVGFICFAMILGAAWAFEASAFIPTSDRTIRAVAQVNRASGRNTALQLEITMSVGGGPTVARGEMISHPSGLARLELRGNSGRIERYLLSGNELLATRNGQPITMPRPLLQPFFLLQPSSAVTLRAGLRSFEVLSESIGLASCGDEDCFVIGDPRLAAPLENQLPEKAELAELESEDALIDPLERPGDGDFSRGRDDRAEPFALDGPELVVTADALLPRLWVDTKDLQVRRIDRADGVFTIFGPVVSYEKLRVPAWFEVHQPNQELIRFEIDRVVQVNAPPKVFSQKWLLTPVTPQTPERPERPERPETPQTSPGASAPAASSPAAP